MEKHRAFVPANRRIMITMGIDVLCLHVSRTVTRRWKRDRKCRKK